MYHSPIYSSTEINYLETVFIEEANKYWIPVFDEYKFKTIYENHQHTHKRSKLLKNNTIDIHGTLYIGDGSWGATVSDDEIMISDLIDNI